MLSGQTLASWAIIALQLVAAYPQGGTGDLPGHGAQWQAALKTDLRSPCPALNAAANIGILPRNGKNITAEMLAEAVVNIYNVEPSFAKTLAQGISGVAATGSKTISLNDLSKHDIIEHDASLVRNDAIQGDNHSVQPTLVKALLDDSTTEYVTVQSIAKTRARREKESKLAGSPALSAKSSTVAYGESALLLQTLGHLGGKSLTYQAPKKAVEEWLGQEKLPTGWVKPPKQITLATTTTASAEILALAKLTRV